MMDINTGKLLSVDNSYSQSINLILLSPKNERVLNRNFGSSLLNYVGRPINEVAIEISAEVIASLQENDQRIAVDSVSVTNNNNQGLLIEVSYEGGLTNVKLS